MGWCEGIRVWSLWWRVFVLTLCLLTFMCGSHGQTRRCGEHCPYFRQCFPTSQVCQLLYRYCQCGRPPSVRPPPRTTTTTVPLLTVKDCGVSSITGPAQMYVASSRIVGGDASAECQFPWMAVVATRSSLCGGSIIDDRHVLTAAHCVVRLNVVVNPRRLTIGVGSSSRNRARRFRVSQVTVHPQYRSSSFSNDVAVITLRRRLQWSQCVRPVCLPDQLDTALVGQICVAAGWGLTNEKNSRAENNLRSVKVPIVSSATCRRIYGSRNFDTNNICAGDVRAGGIDSCRGDSGGPLMCSSGTQWKVMGIVSFGRGCGRRRAPGVYAFVPPYVSWINSVRS